MSRVAALLVVLGAVGSALCTPYWFAWDGADWPENQGWTRVWGDYQGWHHGFGAYRTLENGVLTYDSLYDPGVCDFYEMDRPGQMDPGPGEELVIEWRLNVQQVTGSADPGVCFSSDDAWVVGFHWGSNLIYSAFEFGVTIPFTPGTFHDYRLQSGDMRAYDFFIDGQLARHGTLLHSIGPSEITWGDFVQGAASLHSWDYFHYGVVPEPSGLPVLATLLLRTVRRRG